MLNKGVELRQRLPHAARTDHRLQVLNIDQQQGKRRISITTPIIHQPKQGVLKIFGAHQRQRVEQIACLLLMPMSTHLAAFVREHPDRHILRTQLVGRGGMSAGGAQRLRIGFDE